MLDVFELKYIGNKKKQYINFNTFFKIIDFSKMYLDTFKNLYITFMLIDSAGVVR